MKLREKDKANIKALSNAYEALGQQGSKAAELGRELGAAFEKLMAAAKRG